MLGSGGVKRGCMEVSLLQKSERAFGPPALDHFTKTLGQALVSFP